MNKNDDEVEVNSLIVEEKIMNKNWNFKFGQISSRANPWSTSKWNEGSWSSCMILVTKLGTMQIKLSAVYKVFFSSYCTKYNAFNYALYLHPILKDQIALALDSFQDCSEHLCCRPKLSILSVWNNLVY